MTEALFLNLPALPAAAPGGAAAAARAGSDAAAADSFAAQLERSQAGPAGAQDLMALHEPEPLDESSHEAAANALNDFLAQWLPSAPPAPSEPSVTAPSGLAVAPEPDAPGVNRFEAALAATPASAELGVGAAAVAWASSAAAPPRDAEASGSPRRNAAPSVLPTLRDAAARPGTPARGVGDDGADSSARAAAAGRRGLPSLDLDLNPLPPATAPSATQEAPADAAASPTAVDAAAALAEPRPAPVAAPMPSLPPSAASAAVVATTMTGGRGGAIGTVAAETPRASRPTDAMNSTTERQRPGSALRTGFEAMRGAEPAMARNSGAADESTLPSRPDALNPVPATAAGTGSSGRGGDEPASLAGGALAAAEAASPSRLANGADGAATSSPGASTSEPVPANWSTAPSAVHGIAANAPMGAPMGVPTGVTTNVMTDVTTGGTIATPVQSPQFVEALGVQVSVLARGGVERAELQLNPASMGPLAVQITLDAGLAQVHFGSDSAQTRQIVEAGLPALAAALRDAGFTLSGGGVSQHPGDPRHGAAARGATNFGLRHADAPDDELRPLRGARAALGRLDLYA